MLPEGGRAHVGTIRQVVHVQCLNEVLLEPGDDLRNLLARGPDGDKVPHLRAVRTGQQANGDFLMDERRQPGHQCRLVQQRDEPDQSIEQAGVECFDRDRPRPLTPCLVRSGELQHHTSPGSI
jgi:hypothetical protein